MVRAGNWRQCARGVYFVDDRPFTDAARVRAAVWSYGARAAASGLAAAFWLELTRFPPDIVEVTVPTVASVPVRVSDDVIWPPPMSSSGEAFELRRYR